MTSPISVCWRLRTSVASRSRRPAEDRDRGEERRVAVALDDLGAHRVDAQPEVREDLRLEVRVEVAVRPDRAADLAGRDLGGRGGEPLPAAGDLERPARALEPERRRLGVDRVGAAHHHGPGLGARPGDERGGEPVRAVEQPLPRRAELERERRVDDVAAREPEVEVAALGADRLGDLADERDDVVVGRRARSRRSGRRRPCARASIAARRLGRDEAAARLGAAHGELDLEHALEARLVGPQRAHLGQRVARGSRAAPRRRRDVRRRCRGGAACRPTRSRRRRARPRAARRRGSRPRPRP